MTDGITFKIDTDVLQQLIQNTPENIERFLAQEAELVVNDIKLSMNTSPPGKRYGKHTASQPGYPPNIDLSNLINAISQDSDGALRRVIYDAAGYGGYWSYLELGTEDMKPRPSLGPAMERERQVFAQHARAEGLVKP